MSDTFYELPVSYREYGGAYLANCAGFKASCTSSREGAMSRAAAKAINASGKLKRTVADAEVTLHKRTGDRVGLMRARIEIAESEVFA